MSYQPKPRPRLKSLPMHRPDFRCMCDVCNKPRNRGNHEKCSKERQAAGFLIYGEGK